MTITNRMRRRTGRLAEPLTGDHAAIDLASIMVGVIVLGIIAGVSLYLFAIVPWAQDSAAQQELVSYDNAEQATNITGDGYDTTEDLIDNGWLDGVPGQAGTTDDDHNPVVDGTGDAEAGTTPIESWDGFASQTSDHNHHYAAIITSPTGKTYLVTDTTGVIDYGDRPSDTYHGIDLTDLADKAGLVSTGGNDGGLNAAEPTGPVLLVHDDDPEHHLSIGSAPQERVIYNIGFQASEDPGFADIAPIVKQADFDEEAHITEFDQVRAWVQGREVSISQDGWDALVYRGTEDSSGNPAHYAHLFLSHTDPYLLDGVNSLTMENGWLDDGYLQFEYDGETTTIRFDNVEQRTSTNYLTYDDFDAHIPHEEIVSVAGYEVEQGKLDDGYASLSGWRDYSGNVGVPDYYTQSFPILDECHSSYCDFDIGTIHVTPTSGPTRTFNAPDDEFTNLSLNHYLVDGHTRGFSISLRLKQVNGMSTEDWNELLDGPTVTFNYHGKTNSYIYQIDSQRDYITEVPEFSFPYELDGTGE